MSQERSCQDDPCPWKYDCEGYSDAVKICEGFLDSVITRAVHKNDNLKCSQRKSGLFDPYKNEWPTSGSITVQNAKENIEKLMEKWKSVPGLKDWMYNVEFIALKADQFSEFFLYEVKWSVPTPEYPIPQVTASVFFSIEARHVEPKSFPVDVTYIFEGTQFIHRPEIPFQQKWLYDILDVKTLLFRSFRF